MASEIKDIDLNPVTEIRKKSGKSLVVERTYKNPVTKTDTYVIADLKAQIAKYQAVIDVWQARIDPLQKLIDEYEGMK